MLCRPGVRRLADFACNLVVTFIASPRDSTDPGIPFADRKFGSGRSAVFGYIAVSAPGPSDLENKPSTKSDYKLVPEPICSLVWSSCIMAPSVPGLSPTIFSRIPAL